MQWHQDLNKSALRSKSISIFTEFAVLDPSAQKINDLEENLSLLLWKQLHNLLSLVTAYFITLDLVIQ